jgi:hypothetical protein
MCQKKWKVEVSAFAVGGNVWDLFWWGKWIKISSAAGRWCQVLEVLLGAFGVIEEINSPYVGRGLTG